MPDRSRLSLVVSTAAVAIVLITTAPVRAAGPVQGSEPTALQRLVDRLGVESPSWDWGATFSIAVVDLTTGERAAFQGDHWMKAASSLKMTWMAAAIREVGLAAVEPKALAVMVNSSNDASGPVMMLAGGIDAVNAFTRGIGMNGTLVVEWTFGTNERSRFWPGEHPNLNYTTMRDLTTFWRLLYEGWLLTPEETDALLAWGRIPKPGGAHNALLSRLPDGAVDWVSYKTGILQPGRVYDDDPNGNPRPNEGTDVAIASGVVEIPGGHVYSIAIGSVGGEGWNGKLGFVGYASCRIYEEISGERIGCDRSGDPARSRLDSDPPTGAFDRVRGGAEFLTVSGWAADPDDWQRPILVRFSVDGRWHGITRTGPDGRFTTGLLALLGPGDHEVCAHAINDGDGPDTSIGCRTLTVR